MKNIPLAPPSKHPPLLHAALLLATLGALPAAQLSYHRGMPAPGPHDAHNLVGAARDADNIGGDGQSDGDANDAATYVSGFDRPHQGQTFTTGSNPAGYQINAIHVRHAGYSSNSALTWWCVPADGAFTVRVTRPSAAGTFAFAIAEESARAVGSESGAPNALAPLVSRVNSPNGTGLWLRFTLAKPVALHPNTQYGFDLTARSPEMFFELLGRRSTSASGDIYAGGFAYHGASDGAPDDTLHPLAGDRVFLVELAPALEIARSEAEVHLSWARPPGPVRQVEIFRNTRPAAEGRVRIAAATEPVESHIDKVSDPRAAYWYWLVVTRADGGVETTGPVPAHQAEVWAP